MWDICSILFGSSVEETEIILAIWNRKGLKTEIRWLPDNWRNPCPMPCWPAERQSCRRMAATPTFQVSHSVHPVGGTYFLKNHSHQEGQEVLSRLCCVEKQRRVKWILSAVQPCTLHPTFLRVWVCVCVLLFWWTLSSGAFLGKDTQGAISLSPCMCESNLLHPDICTVTCLGITFLCVKIIFS